MSEHSFPEIITSEYKHQFDKRTVSKIIGFMSEMAWRIERREPKGFTMMHFHCDEIVEVFNYISVLEDFIYINTENLGKNCEK